MILTKDLFYGKLFETGSVGSFEFPNFSSSIVTNGLKLFVHTDSSLQLIVLRIAFATGACDEPKPGLAYFAGQMLLRGTKRRRGSEIADAIEQLGASLNVSTLWDETVISLIVLPKYFDSAFAILLECIYESTFPYDKIVSLKKKHLSTIQQECADPGYLADLAFNKAFFESAGYSSARIGVADSITSITQEECRKWHKENLLRSRISTTICCGEELADNIKNTISRKVIPAADFKDDNHKPNMSGFQTQSSKDSLRIFLINKPDATQSSLKLGFTAPSPQEPDYSLVYFVNTVFGGYFHSRLNMELRERRGLTYGVHSFIDGRKRSNALVAGSSMNLEKTCESIKLILEEKEKLASKALDAGETEAARSYMLGSFIRSIETPQQIASMIYNIDKFGLTKDFYNVFFEKIRTANADELFEAQRKYFSKAKVDIALAAPKDELLDSLASIADVIHLDLNGKII